MVEEVGFALGSSAGFFVVVDGVRFGFGLTVGSGSSAGFFVLVEDVRFGLELMVGSGSSLGFWALAEGVRLAFPAVAFDVEDSPGRVRIISSRSSSEITSIFISFALLNFASLVSRPATT